MQHTDFPAGPNQTLVAYLSDDTANEIDPTQMFGEVAADAQNRAAAGWSIVSVAAAPTRHAQAFLGREGSGYETKAAVCVVYSHP
jgi:hypothetical protein